MTPEELARLRPGIERAFASCRGTVTASLEGKGILISYRALDLSVEEKTFPIPSRNADLSVPLALWTTKIAEKEKPDVGGGKV